ncbi:MAG: Holliday junction resolvase RuvX [bacterium]
MRLLGIDYGRRKVGLAISEGKVAEPLYVIRYSDEKALGASIGRIIKEFETEKVVVGVSEGEMGEESKNFGQSLSQKLQIPVETFDETLSTHDAQRVSVEAGINRKKRKSMEDAYAAAIMLQGYLDAV